MHISITRATAAGFAVAALVAGGATMPSAAATPQNTRESVCGAMSLCANEPIIPPHDFGDQDTAERSIIEGYVIKQKACTPATPPQPQSIAWDPPGFIPNIGGTGNIIDANPNLGGHFHAWWNGEQWFADYEFC